MTQKKNNDAELKLIYKKNTKKKENTVIHRFEIADSNIKQRRRRWTTTRKKEGDGGDVILSSIFFLASSPCSHHRSELDHTSLHLLRDKNYAKRKNSECCRNRLSDQGIEQYKRARAHTHTHTHTHTR